MTRRTQVLALVYSDIKNVVRDPILIMSLVGPIMMAVVIRFGVPLVSPTIYGHFGFELTRHVPFIAGFVTLMTPLMLGMLAGFLLLDERDQDLLSYFAVTPLTKAGFVAYRLTVPVILNFFLTLTLLQLLHPLVETKLSVVTPVVVMASMQAPTICLFLGAFAENKVQGLALSKAFGILNLAPLVGYLFSSPWKYVAGIVPTFWVPLTFLSASDSLWAYLVNLGFGLLNHGFYLFFLWRRFNRKMN